VICTSLQLGGVEMAIQLHSPRPTLHFQQSLLIQLEQSLLTLPHISLAKTLAASGAHCLLKEGPTSSDSSG